ncbi:MAG: hypothetical protein GTO03_08730 [Planctomycetales bacterium]|nr:hypothetical protein [Planctomycetales bacterium]
MISGRYRRVGMILGVTCVALLCGMFAKTAFTEGPDRPDKQKKPKDGHHWREMSPEKVFQRIDKDGDGSLSQEEFTAAFEKHRQRMREFIERHRGAGHGPGHHHRWGGDSAAGKGKGGCPHCRAGQGMRPGVRPGGGQPVVIHNHYYGGGPRPGFHHPRPPHHGRGHGHPGWHGRPGEWGPKRGPAERDRAASEAAAEDAEVAADEIRDPDGSPAVSDQQPYSYGDDVAGS